MRVVPDRHAKLRASMRAAGVDIVALTPGPSLRYLSERDWQTGGRPLLALLPLAGEPALVCPTQLGEPSSFAYHDAESPQAALRQALESLAARGKVIGVEASRLRYSEARLLSQCAPHSQLLDISAQLASLRMIKDATEIAAIRRAIALSEAALQDTLAFARAGISERELAARLDTRLFQLGADGLAFATLLHAGANTALPHTAPLAYRIQPGDPLLIDFGARTAGYCADITRTVFVGAMTAAQRDFYAVVEAANAAARAVAGPGVSAEAVDVAARQVIIAAGFGDLIRHRSGHGIGLLAHEAPYIVRGNQQTLQPGMVFTIEPGIYRMGEIGVRIEDDILITRAGAESLTSFPRGPMVV